jgi:hypothetical protein
MMLSACIIGSHALCQHRENWRSRHPSEVMCSCDCHRSCPLYGRDEISLDMLRSCTCPGSEQAREQGVLPGEKQFIPPEPPGSMRERLDQRRKRSLGIEEAMRSARVLAAGRHRDEARSIVVAELRRNGVEPLPSDSALDNIVDAILSEGSLTGRVRHTVRGVRAIGNVGVRIAKNIKEAHEPLRTEAGWSLDLTGKPLFVNPDRSLPAIGVSLDANAQVRLGAQISGASAAPGLHEIFVLLTAKNADSDCSIIAVQVGKQLAGFIDTEASRLYESAIETGARLDRPVVAEAILSRETTDGPWRLHVYHPRPGFRAS